MLYKAVNVPKMEIVGSKGIDGRKLSIYVLVDPLTGTARYLGRTYNRPTDRKRNHIRESGIGSPKGTWIENLILLGVEPRLVVIDEIYIGQSTGGSETSKKRYRILADRIEKKWIIEMKQRGHKLTNQRVTPRDPIEDIDTTVKPVNINYERRKFPFRSYRFGSSINTIAKHINRGYSEVWIFIERVVNGKSKEYFAMSDIRENYEEYKN